MAVWSRVKVRGRGLSLRPIGCTSALSLTQKHRCNCGMRIVALYFGYMPMLYGEHLLTKLTRQMYRPPTS